MMHPHAASYFESERPEIHGFVENVLIAECINRNKSVNILIKAPVKCGKREIGECISVLMPTHKVIYVTSLNRVDVKNQQDELELYGILTFIITEKCVEATAQITEWLASGLPIVVILDECDYGTGSTGSMRKFYDHIRSNNSIIKMYFSATPEETLHSALSGTLRFAFVEFTPPASYCGAQWFLDNDCWYEPDIFFEEDEGIVSLTDHGSTVMRESFTTDRNVGVVRVTGRKISARLVKANIKALETATNLRRLPTMRPFKFKVVSNNDKFNWEDEETRGGYVKKPLAYNYIFVIFQTCTRGTDLKGWHHRLAFWHDARSRKDSNLNTLVQAMLRPTHYTTMYEDEEGEPEGQLIRMYVDNHVLDMAAGGSMTEYLAAGGKPPIRMKRINGSTRQPANPDEFDIEVSEFQTLVSAQERFPSIGRDARPNANGFYESANKQKRHVLSMEELNDVTSNKTNTLSNKHREMLVGVEHAQIKLFIGYKDTSDPSTACFRVKKVWRTSEPAVADPDAAPLLAMKSMYSDIARRGDVPQYANLPMA
jgi:hypothetical protein